MVSGGAVVSGLAVVFTGAVVLGCAFGFVVEAAGFLVVEASVVVSVFTGVLSESGISVPIACVIAQPRQVEGKLDVLK